MDQDNRERVQTLLRRMAQDHPGRQASRDKFASIVKGLTNQVDESEQYIALTELCTTLSMATEDVLMSLRPEQLVPPILACLQKDYNLDLMLLAARAVTYLIEAMPMSTIVIASEGGIPILCEKLRNIVEIELAEQCLQALERFAVEQPAAVLRDDGVSAMLGFIDFFNITVQRKVLVAVAAICRRATPATFHFLESSLPQIRQFLRHEDTKLAESAALCLQRVLPTVEGDEAKLAAVIGGDELCMTIVDLLRNSKGTLFASMLKLLDAVLHVSPAMCKVMLDHGIMEVLTDLLGGGPRQDMSAISGGSTPMSLQPSSPHRDIADTPPGISQLPSSVADFPSTPPHSASRLSAQKPLGSQLTPDLVNDVLAAVLSLLPPVQDGYMLYLSRAQKPSATTASSPSVVRRIMQELRGLGGPGSAPAEEEEEEEGTEDGEEGLHHEEELLLAHRALLGPMAATRNIALEHKPQGTYHINRHSCDGCNKRALRKLDWFRCNDCPDMDLCLTCLLSSGGKHCTDKNHSFTDMSLEIGGASGATPAAPRAIVPVASALTPLYTETPALLHPITSFLPCLLHIIQESDNTVSRNRSLEILARALHLESAEYILTVFQDVSISTCLAGVLSSSEVTPVALAIFICRTLLAKQPAAVTPAFVREGVVNALTLVKSSQTDLPDTKEELKTATATEAGWKTLLAQEAAETLEPLLGTELAGASKALTNLRKGLEAGNVTWGTFWQELCDVLDEENGISTFELVSSNIVQTIVSLLQKADDPVLLVLEMQAALGRASAKQQRASPPSPSMRPLDASSAAVTYGTLFVRLVQSVLSQYESLPVASGGATQGSALRTLTQHMHLTLAGPHEQKDGTTKDKSVTVMIEPLATTGAVAEFIQTKLLVSSPTSPSRSEPPGPPKDVDDEVENIVLSGEEDESESADTKKRRKERSQRRSRAPQAGQGITLRIGDAVLPHHLTMVQVVSRYGNGGSGAKAGTPMARMLESRLTIHFSKATPSSPTSDGAKAESSEKSGSTAGGVVLGSHTRGSIAVVDACTKPLPDPDHGEWPPLIANTLALLRILHAANTQWPSLVEWARLNQNGSYEDLQAVSAVDHNEFVNQKVATKCGKYSSDPMLICGEGGRSWARILSTHCPFLIPFQQRKALFDSAFLGPGRALMRLQERIQESGEPMSEAKSTRIQRHKMRVRRDKVLECAKRVMKLYCTSRHTFEFEFDGEQGSGLGPTQEFYTLVAHKLQTKALGLWRHDNATDPDAPELIISPAGLFPDVAKPDTADTFRFMGQLAARAVLDKRIFDVPLSRTALRLLRNDRSCLEDLQDLGGALYQTAAAIYSAVAAGQDTLSLNGKTCNVEDLCLDFTLPGNAGVELCPNGAETPVTRANMKDYADALLQSLLGDTVQTAIGAFREGFNDLIPVHGLSSFTAEELDFMFRGHDEPITMVELEACTTCDHGFSLSSKPVRMFFEILTEMDQKLQQKFVQFLTGAPKLPIGGLRNLRPKFTIVRKTASDGVSEQGQLPSVMTCQNFLKLPAYDTKQVMQEKLVQAISEGAGVFSFT